jgi:hypothetical protein
MYMLILNFTYPLRCRRVPPVEYHWSNATGFGISLYIRKLPVPTRGILIIYPKISSLMYTCRLHTLTTKWVESLLKGKGRVVSSGKAGAF